jgi:hypothetical protein
MCDMGNLEVTSCDQIDKIGIRYDKTDTLDLTL